MSIVERGPGLILVDTPVAWDVPDEKEAEKKAIAKIAGVRTMARLDRRWWNAGENDYKDWVLFQRLTMLKEH